MQKRPFSNPALNIGVLGGGQLGKMLAQAAGQWDIHLSLLDKDNTFPAAAVSGYFVEGDFKDFTDVLHFGEQCDIVTIEIETINTKALAVLEEKGITVHPCARVVDLIRDKGKQKQFYRVHQLPTAGFRLYDSKAEIIHAVETHTLRLPFVQKARTEGYDGRGVCVVRTDRDLEEIFDVPSLVEDCIDIEVELSVIVARNARGEIRAFPPVAMAFHPTANLVEYLYCPSGLDPAIEKEATEIAKAIIADFDMCGLLAVELFVTKEGRILINEVAPRPHNSGHHTIESCNISQYQQHLLAICDLPLVDVKLYTPAVMVNLLGHPDHRGPVRIEGITDCLDQGHVHFHFYGKKETRPYRKMGHATILASTVELAMQKAEFVKNNIHFIT